MRSALEAGDHLARRVEQGQLYGTAGQHNGRSASAEKQTIEAGRSTLPVRQRVCCAAAE